MPVVVVTAPPLPGLDALPAVLSSIAAAVAGPLDLRPDDVVVTAMTAQATVVGNDLVPGWPVVVLHGSPRDRTGLRNAEQGARDAVARAWAVPDEKIWSQWLIRRPDEP